MAAIYNLAELYIGWVNTHLHSYTYLHTIQFQSVQLQLAVFVSHVTI